MKNEGHVHSMYSIHDSTMSPEKLAIKAKESGIENIALTDHGTLLGIDDFMKACKEQGVNGIPGEEKYISLDDKFDIYKKYSKDLHLITIAKNYKGYQSIVYSNRDANANQREISKKNYRPITTGENLETYFAGNENVIITSACMQGPIAQILLIDKKIEQQKNKKLIQAEKYKAAYDVYYELKPQVDALADDIKEMTEDKSFYGQYLKPAYIKKMKAAEDESNQMTLFGDNNAFEEMKKNHETAKAIMEKLEKELDEAKTKKSELSKLCTSYKSKADNYKNVLQELDNIELHGEEFLYEKAKEIALYFKNTYPNFYIELQYHGLEEEAYTMPLMARIAQETGIPVIAANDAHMPDNSEDSIKARQIVRFNYFEKHQDVSDADKELYLKTNEEMFHILSEILDENVVKEAIDNTNIFKECLVKFPEEKHYPKTRTEESFDQLLDEAKAKKIAEGSWNDEYETRLEYEKNVIKTMGYVDYHMVVREFCFKARQLGIIPKRELKYIPNNFAKVERWISDKGYSVGVGVGPGRGSAAGSLVCYLLGITNVDPLKYNLLFERFLNPERVSMPDIDTDIKTSLRPIIIRYLKWAYGERAVCSIMTKNTYAAKNSIQMCGRDRSSELYDGIKDKEEKETKKREYMKLYMNISGLIPEEPGITLSKCEQAFMDEFKGNAEAQIIWENAKLIEGVISNTGIHAGGVVISDNDNINDYVALSWNEEKQVWATQCDMIQVEEKGLLKMDLLGLNTLDIISDCLHLIKERTGLSIDLDKIAFENEVFANIYATGETNSVFQFESGGMKKMLKDFKPTCIEDIILLNAAYRPGPMQYLENIIEVKHGRRPLMYKTPELENILAPTYGAIIYQEQVMQIFQKLAGYSLGGADMVRRAMSKKKMDKLTSEKEAFVHGDATRNICGCVANGIKEDVAIELFDEMIDFAKYAFNKSHAASYAIVSYQTAWLKHHYPVEFCCAVFNNKEQDAFGPIIEDCKTYNIKLLPPDVNQSYYDFTIEDNNIRFGLKGVKGVGNDDIVNEIVSCRMKSTKPFVSFTDFVIRTLSEEGSLLDKRFMDATICAGIYDCLIPNRESLLDFYAKVAEIIKNGKDVNLIKEQILLSNEMQYHNEPDMTYNLKAELNYLGTIVSRNPLDDYQDDEHYGCDAVNELTNGLVNILGLVVGSESKKSKRSGKPMTILNLDTKTGAINVLIAGSSYNQYAGQSFDGQVVKINGSYSDGTVFGRAIQSIKPKADTYHLDVTELDEWLRVAPIINANKGSGQEELYVRSPFVKKERLSHAKVYGPFLVSEDIIQQVKATKYK